MESINLNVQISEGHFEDVLATAYSPTVTISELIKNASDACHTKNDIITITINTLDKTICVKDNGTGLSKNDILALASVGDSKKMKQGNELSAIGEPYAGSKGLGILTAFNLCDELEITTYSSEDNKSYILNWKKGTNNISGFETQFQQSGTTLVLKNISSDSIDMLLRKEEINKLLLSSISYYNKNTPIPSINLYIDDVKYETSTNSSIEDIYKKHNKPKTTSKNEPFFIAKATFKYSNNKLILSYDDNIYNAYSFTNEEINLSDTNSIREFLSSNNISFQNFESRLGNYDSKTTLDDFEGVYYVWRSKKHEDITLPYGIRIYINNYGLYNYLGQSNDWTQLTEISQNIKNTNFKFRNTYGYVVFKNFNEEKSNLKISKERNDFIGNLARKKFYHLMREFISGIFSSIDITLKKNKGNGLAITSIKTNRRTVINTPIDIREMVRSDFSCQQLLFEHDSHIMIDREKGLIYANSPGDHTVNVSNGIYTITLTIHAFDPTPEFELRSIPTKIREGNTYDLRKSIIKKSLVNINIDDITIESTEAAIDRHIMRNTNRPDTYTVHYSYASSEHPTITKTHEIIITPLFESQTRKLKKLFPDYTLIDDYYKLNDVVDQISNGYINSPIICGIALRSLVEISMKHFIEDVLGDKIERELNTLSQMNMILNAIGQNDPRLNPIITSEYKDKLLSSRKRLTKYYQELDLNHYVHDYDSIITSNEILAFSRRLQNFLGFIFKSLAIKKQRTVTA